MSEKRNNISCSFCGKTQDLVNRLIAGPSGGVYICNECIDICNDILDADVDIFDGDDDLVLGELPKRQISRKFLICMS